MNSEIWAKYGGRYMESADTSTTINSGGSNCYEQVSGYMNKLLKECLEGMEGVSTDTIHLSDLGFVIFVLARH